MREIIYLQIWAHHFGLLNYAQTLEKNIFTKVKKQLCMTHQRLSDAVLLSNITEVSRDTGLKPDVVPILGIILWQKQHTTFFPATSSQVKNYRGLTRQKEGEKNCRAQNEPEQQPGNTCIAPAS